MKYNISELIMNNEELYYEDNEKLKAYRKVKIVDNAGKKKYLTWVDDKNMTSITTPELIDMLMQETANHRNAFILGDIDEPTIETKDIEIADGDER